MKCYSCGKEEKDGSHLLGLCKFSAAPQINLNICVACKKEINPPNRRGYCNESCFKEYFMIE